VGKSNNAGHGSEGYMQPPAAKVPEERKATEYLANERTFLAWIRTSIAIISLGFVVAKFGLWLGELASRVDLRLQSIRTGASLPIGVTISGFGGLLAVLAAWRYHVVNRNIERGTVKADRGLVVLVTVLMTLLTVVMIVYLLVTVEHR
jgi:putative membrane protein